MSTTFIQKIRQISETKKAEIDKIIAEKAEVRAKIRDDKFRFLTEKYHPIIKNGIEHAAERGRSEKYINFEKDDFKANYPGLGFPNEFQKEWLKEMCNPCSSYIPVDKETGEKIHFQGLSFEVWGNGSFTTVFTW